MTKVSRNITRRLLALLMWLCACFGANFSASAQVDAEQVMIIGRNVLSLDDYMLAIQYFNQAIAAKPYLSDPYYYRGLAKLMLEDYRGAEADCGEAISRNKFKPEAYRVRGFARMHLRKDSDAIADFDEGLRYLPHDKYFLYYKAVAQTDASLFNDATLTFDRLLKLFPNFDEGLTARARMHLLAGDTVASLADIDRTIAVSRNQLTPYLIRAEIESHRGEWEAAARDMDKAVELQPRDADIYVNRAFVRYNNDDWFGAMSDYNYALDLEPEHRAAFYNRALLRYRVQDFMNASKDFSKILEWEPDNFFARYNRGLINLELGHPRQALTDFKIIAKKYPRFYPVYHAMAQAHQQLGNQKAYIDNIFKANELIGKYLANPGKNALDRPTIQAGKSYTQDDMSFDSDTLTDVEIMERFNQLITVNDSKDSHVAYKDKISGKVQDLDMRVEPQPFYLLTYSDNTDALNGRRNYYRELEVINRSQWLPERLFVAVVSDVSDMQLSSRMFENVDLLNSSEQRSKLRPVDYLDRGVAYSLLKNYGAAMADLDKAIEADSSFASPYLQRAGVRMLMHEAGRRARHSSDAERRQDAMFEEAERRESLSKSIADLDAALALDESISFAWYDKGLIYYELKDYTSALHCFTKAIELNGDFGDAYYNRALVYMHLGNRQQGIADLSKAGELGVVPSYNLLKKIR